MEFQVADQKLFLLTFWVSHLVAVFLAWSRHEDEKRRTTIVPKLDEKYQWTVLLFMLTSKRCPWEGFSVGCRGRRLHGYVQQPWGVSFCQKCIEKSIPGLWERTLFLCFVVFVSAIFTSQSQTFSTSPSIMGHHGIGHLHFFWLVATCSGATEPLMKFGKLRF